MQKGRDSAKKSVDAPDPKLGAAIDALRVEVERQIDREMLDRERPRTLEMARARREGEGAPGAVFVSFRGVTGQTCTTRVMTMLDAEKNDIACGGRPVANIWWTQVPKPMNIVSTVASDTMV